MSAKKQKIPFPPSPANVPEGFTDYADSFTKRQNLLLAGLFVFLIFYVSMVIFFAMVGTWCVLTIRHLLPLKVFGIAMCGIFFLYLIKGFFKRPSMNKEMHIEITEDEQPVLFGFIDQLCEELGAPLPNKVYVSPDVNAACMYRTSLINLFVEPKRDLLIGLGLVNCMNLSEFKAVLAHEFGHFCQSGPTKSYFFVVYRIIFDLVAGEDWFDRIIHWLKNQENWIAIVGYSIGGCLWVGRKALMLILNVFTLQATAFSREQEFHADKVAVSAAGSDASTHGLLRARFGMQCFIQAISDLVAPARDHKIYTNDLYLHQDRAAEVVRRKKKEPELGLPPVLPFPTSGETTKVFDAEQDELEDDDETPPMWRTHPPDADREKNAKEVFITAVVDHRSPWILFSKAAELKERMTYKFYRMEFRIVKDSDLTAAIKVQEYIDNEHAEITYDPKYHGAYDDRPLEPGDLNELNTIVYNSPWPEERMLKVYDKLYEGCREHAETHADLHKEQKSLKSNVVGKPSAKVKKMFADIEKKLDANWEWFKSFDRRVYLLHLQMAASIDEELRQEFIERYRFQLEVQRFYQSARNNYNDSESHLNVYFAAMRGEIKMQRDFGAQVIAVLRAAWKALKKIVQDAREINLPAMKNFEEGERLADFILEGKMVPEPPLSELKGVWVQKLMTQLLGVKNRCFRLHFKSVGGLLAIQEKIASQWLAVHRPIDTDLIPVETIEAEVIVGEVVGDANPTDLIVAEVVEEPLQQSPEQPEVILEFMLPSEPNKPAMAAFVATPAHQPSLPKTDSPSRPNIPAAAVSEPTVPFAPTAAVPRTQEQIPSTVELPIELDADLVKVVAEELKPFQPMSLTGKVSTASAEATVPVKTEVESLVSLPPLPPEVTISASSEAEEPAELHVSQAVSESEPSSTLSVETGAKSPHTHSVAEEPTAPDVSQAVSESETVSTSNAGTGVESHHTDMVGQVIETPSNAPDEQLSDRPLTQEIGYNTSEARSATITQVPSQNADSIVAESPDLPAPFSEPAPTAEEQTSFDAMKKDPKTNKTKSNKKPPAEEPISIEEVFSLDGDDARASTAKSQKAQVGEPIPIEEVFSLDFDEAPPIDAEVLPLEELIPVEEVFELDADGAARAVAMTPAVAELIPVEEIIPLEEVEATVPAAVEQTSPVQNPAAPVEVVFSPNAEQFVVAEIIEAEVPTRPAAPSFLNPSPANTVQPTAKSATAPIIHSPMKPSPFGTPVAPASRPAFGSAAKPTVAATKESEPENTTPTPPKPKRPQVRISMVKPGGKSPFGK